MAVSETFEWSTSASASEIFTQGPRPTTEAWKANAGKCLYLYLDESGNLDFGTSGSKYFLMTCAVTTRPFTAAGKLRDIKFDLIETGKDIEKLHACEDSDATRTLVYNSLSESAGSYRVYTAYIDKALLNEREKTPDSVYSMVFEMLIDEIYRSEHLAWVERAIVTTDKLPKDATRRQVTKPLKRYMKEKFQTRHIPYSLFHRDSSSDMNLQAADYFCWAAHREITFGKDWPIKKVRGSFKQIGEIKTKKADRALRLNRLPTLPTIKRRTPWVRIDGREPFFIYIMPQIKAGKSENPAIAQQHFRANKKATSRS